MGQPRAGWRGVRLAVQRVLRLGRQARRQHISSLSFRKNIPFFACTCGGEVRSSVLLSTCPFTHHGLSESYDCGCHPTLKFVWWKYFAQALGAAPGGPAGGSLSPERSGSNNGGTVKKMGGVGLPGMGMPIPMPGGE